MNNKKEIDQLLVIMAQLRDPNRGCPWDIEQTFNSISSCSIEEAYEVCDAIDRNDMSSLKEELGDLLLQIVFHSQIAKELGFFSFSDVVNALIKKMIKRHPHIFNDINASHTPIEHRLQWEQRKTLERETQAESLLDGIAISLPALLYAKKIQLRAASVGFNWNNLKSVFNKINEELSELLIEIDKDSETNNREEEFGDVLFAMVNLAQHLKLNPEDALRKSSKKFIKRFKFIERTAAGMNKKITDLTETEIDELWQKAKAKQDAYK